MTERPWRTLAEFLGLCLCVSLVVIGIHKYYFREPLNRDLIFSWGLLMLNACFFLAFSQVHSTFARKWGLSFGLLLLSVKLFVNTFTIFLFIGLQAVRTHVFVSEFFSGYAVLLSGGILFLHRNSQRF